MKADIKQDNEIKEILADIDSVQMKSDGVYIRTHEVRMGVKGDKIIPCSSLSQALAVTQIGLREKHWKTAFIVEV